MLIFYCFTVCCSLKSEKINWSLSIADKLQTFFFMKIVEKVKKKNLKEMMFHFSFYTFSFEFTVLAIFSSFLCLFFILFHKINPIGYKIHFEIKIIRNNAIVNNLNWFTVRHYKWVYKFLVFLWQISFIGLTLELKFHLTFFVASLQLHVNYISFEE